MLRRRAFLGVGVREVDGGLAVTRVTEGAMAAHAGLAAGDVIVAIDREAIASVAALGERLRGARGSIVLSYVRLGARADVEVEVRECPRETLEGAVVRYGEARHAELGARLRTIVTSPREGGARPAILLVPGIACASIDFGLTPGAPLAQLLRGWTERGLTTLRVERPGLGDSEGPPCAALDPRDELACYAAGLAALRDDPAVDRERIFVFGHSVGGMLAPLLGERFPDLRGAIVYGTSARRWSRCLRDGVERQLALRGRAPEEIAARLARFDEEPFEERHGRTLAYHQALEALELTEVWARASMPALVVIGEHDWVVSEEEQRAIAALAREAEVLALEGLDHAFTTHPSREASLSALGAGALHTRLAEETARWVLARS